MKLIAKIKLQPNIEQHQQLLDTLRIANDACNYISDVAWGAQVFGQFNIHKLVYHDVRIKFALSAQVTVRCISKVTDAYKLDRKTKRSFGEFGAIPYDDRILRYWIDKETVSIWTVGGRQKMSFTAGPRQIELLQSRKGESDLTYIDDGFYLFAICDIDEPTPDDVIGVLGVDLVKMCK